MPAGWMARIGQRLLHGDTFEGMRQKVLIAAALIHDPELVVLDEPNSGLDVAATLVLRSLVATLAERRRVIIYSSHMLDAVEKVFQKAMLRSDRAATWYAGLVVAASVVQRLRRQFVARHITLQFESSPSSAMATLDLSEALG